MSPSRCFVLCLLFLLLAVPLRAQWQGSIDLFGGYGFRSPRFDDDNALDHALGETEVKLNYLRPKWKWSNSLKTAFELKETDTDRLSFVQKGEDDYDMESLEKTLQNTTFRLNLNSTVNWSRVRGREYEAWLQYETRIDNGMNGTSTEKYREEHFDGYLYMEEPTTELNKLITGIRTSHWLGSPKTVLKGVLSFEGKWQDKSTTWLNVEIEDDYDDMTYKAYRVTPSSSSNILNAHIHLIDSIRTPRAYRLVLDPGLRVKADYTRDRNSGATMDFDTEEWRDSVQLRESFNFLAIQAEPYLAADFSWSALKAHLDYSPQVYSRRLTDETHHQNLKTQRPYPVGNALISWAFSPSQKLVFKNKLSVKHPDYIQICWYERQGAYLNQIYRGKESLLPIQTGEYTLGYEFKKRRFFSTTEVSYTSRRNEIDQTFTKETINGRDYKVFTWVNASDSRVLSLEQKLGWKSKRLTANLGIKYNGTTRTAREGGTVKRTTDWKTWADVMARLNKGWSVNADVKYQSDVATFFTLFKQYCALNACIQKDFKRFSLYLKGRDLLDSEVEREFESENGKEYWIERSRLNRRMMILGFKWNF